jgi:molybdopterin molybdotransferase
MMGLANYNDRKIFLARLTRTVRKRAGRMEFVRGMLSYSDNNILVTPALGQDSHMLSGLAQANCLIHFPLESEVLNEDSHVSVELLDWRL